MQLDCARQPLVDGARLAREDGEGRCGGGRRPPRRVVRREAVDQAREERDSVRARVG